MTQPPIQRGNVQPNYATPQGNDVVSTMIPYKNGYGLAAYYVGIFSILPVIGAISGPVAIFLGIKGVMAANRNPAVKGMAHAIVGIICGALFGLFWIVVDVAILIAIMAPRPSTY